MCSMCLCGSENKNEPHRKIEHIEKESKKNSYPLNLQINISSYIS